MPSVENEAEPDRPVPGPPGGRRGILVPDTDAAARATAERLATLQRKADEINAASAAPGEVQARRWLRSKDLRHIADLLDRLDADAAGGIKVSGTIEIPRVNPKWPNVTLIVESTGGAHRVLVCEGNHADA